MKNYNSIFILFLLIAQQAFASNVRLYFADRRPLFGNTDHLSSYGKCYGASVRGLIYTASHCLGHFDHAYTSSLGKLSSQMSTVCRNQDARDIAILDANDYFTGFEIASSLPEVGETVEVNEQGYITKCKVLGYEARAFDGYSWKKQLKTDCTFGAGYSGIGITNSKGELIGVLSNTMALGYGNILYNYFETIVGEIDCN